MPEFLKKPALRHAWAAVALWVLVYGALKLFSLDGLDIDSAEQVYFAQSWQMGYGTRGGPFTLIHRGGPGSGPENLAESYT